MPSETAQEPRHPMCTHQPVTHHVFVGTAPPFGACAACYGWYHAWGILLNTKKRTVVRVEEIDA